MRVSQRARLIDANITTMHALAGHSGPVPDMSARAVTALAAQSRLQVTAPVDGKPAYEVVELRAAQIPNQKLKTSIGGKSSLGEFY